MKPGMKSGRVLLGSTRTLTAPGARRSLSIAAASPKPAYDLPPSRKSRAEHSVYSWVFDPAAARKGGAFAGSGSPSSEHKPRGAARRDRVKDLVPHGLQLAPLPVHL
jgi:hypothetical protein